ncbi:cytochrome P450 4c3-like [Cylas formicarius]|uniref:cytochrome P450 4c3-like n=1 Tax=Cylas formicarius TaxID=197179 RepID=UPI0029583CF6|nr:cytochrome P450 4c3-like [Cylas formicarius]
MVTFAWWLSEFSLVLIFFVVCWLWLNRKEIVLSRKLPGPRILPLVGNALEFWCKDEDIFDRAVELVGSYPSPMRFWFGPKFTVMLRDAEHIEKILPYAKFSNKSEDIYKFLKVFNGEGLITSSGAKWKKDRKLISPLFLKRSVMKYFRAILRHAQILADILSQKVDGATFNVEHYIHRATTDIVNETVLGIRSDAQNGELDELLCHIARCYEIVHRRIIKFWLQNDFLYMLSNYYSEQQAAIRVIQEFFNRCLKAVEARHALPKQECGTRSVLDQMVEIRRQVPDFVISDQQMIDHMATLQSAAEDTIAVICSFSMLMLGKYPEYQTKVFDEIVRVVGRDEALRQEHLPKLEYMDMFLKEVLRLFPIGPFIVRVASDDANIAGCEIPKGTSIVLAIHNVHRDARYWERPDDFYPDHFLPEAARSRHPYAYIPFSAGPRGCVGKTYAQMTLKIILTTVLQKYEIEADGSLKDLALTTDISVRSKDNIYPIRLRKRM